MKSWFFYLRRALSPKKIPDNLVKAPVNSFPWRKLLPFTLRYWRKALAGIILILLVSLLAYPQPLITRFFIDQVLLAKKLNLFVLVVACIAGFKLLETLGGIFQRFYFTRFEQDIIRVIQHDLLSRIMHFPKDFFDDKETGYLVARVSNDVNGLRWFFSMTLVSIISNILRFSVGLCLLFYLEWKITLVALIFLPAIFLGVRFFSRKLYILSHQNMEASAKVSQRMQEVLSSIPLIKAFTTERREIGTLMNGVKTVQKLALENTALSSLASLSITAFKELAKLTALVLGGLLIIAGQWTVGSLLAFQAYLGFVFEPANFFAQTNFSFQNAMASLQRILAFYDILPEAGNLKGKKVAHLRGKIEFREVFFSYDGKEDILKDISFIIQPGERVAVVGKSGVGKTTLISLILGFYRPLGGKILFDDKPEDYYQLKSLRARIGYVSQNTRLFSATLSENLKYGKPEATLLEIETACRMAGIHDFIVKLKDGYAAKLGENGVNLSEGQRQRLAIARALIKDPDILIMDEPTAALDSAVEESIFAGLPEGIKEKTLIVITHRTALLDKFDKVFKLEEGRIIFVP